MKAGYWVLDDAHNAVPADLREWGAFFEKGARTVDFADVHGVRVSSVFLGMDHNYGDGEPILFETMTFGDPFEGHCWRWRTWDETQAGHDAIVAALRAGTDPDAVESPG